MDLRRSPNSAHGTSAYRARNLDRDNGHGHDGHGRDRANDLGHDRGVQSGVDRAHRDHRLLQRRSSWEIRAHLLPRK
jgi:hypothetical protein